MMLLLTSPTVKLFDRYSGYQFWIPNPRFRDRYDLTSDPFANGITTVDQTETAKCLAVGLI